MAHRNGTTEKRRSAKRPKALALRVKEDGLGPAELFAGGHRNPLRAPVRTKRRRRIVVLGAGGFIGSHLVPRLVADGDGDTEIEAVDLDLRKLAPELPRVRRRVARVGEPALLEELIDGADVVVSLTALCNPALYNTRPLDVIDASYTDLVPLVKLCAERRVWLVHFSTCEVYGKVALDQRGRPTTRMVEDETSLFLGPIARERWTYAAAKQLLERVIWAYGRHAGLRHTIIRPFNVIGPRMDFMPGVDGEGVPRVLASFLHALMTGADLLLVGGGRQRRSFIDVTEFVDGVVRVLARPEASAGQIINLGNPRNDVSVRRLARSLMNAYRTLRPHAPVPGLRSVTAEDLYGEGYDDSEVRIPSIAKATRLLGWNPAIALDEMLPGIVADYLERYEDRLQSEMTPAVRAAGRRG